MVGIQANVFVKTVSFLKVLLINQYLCTMKLQTSQIIYQQINSTNSDDKKVTYKIKLLHF